MAINTHNENRRLLDDIPAGMKVRIIGVEAGQALKKRLSEMGLLPNTELEVVRNDGAGQIILNVKKSKIILGRGMSHKIYVENV